jgi:glucokinase
MPGRLAGLEGLDWTSFLNRRELVPVLNDAHAALVGEARVGAARGLRNVYMLTLGTGVGGAVMMGGGLMRGHIGRAGHLGHMTVDLDGPPDITGLPGGLEDFVGDCTVRARTGGRFGSTLELVEAVAGGDREAGVCWQRSMHALACGIASLNNILDPEAVILGGGIVGAGAQLLGPLREALARVEWRPLGCGVPLRLAQLGEWAGAVGAAFNGLERARELKRGRAADPT